MLKDMRIALGIAQAAGTESRLSAAAVGLWAQAAADLPAGADHTEIARWLARLSQAASTSGELAS
jgi:3-hydroxyisobutyrate dehydrogenase